MDKNDTYDFLFQDKLIEYIGKYKTDDSKKAFLDGVNLGLMFSKEDYMYILPTEAIWRDLGNKNNTTT